MSPPNPNHPTQLALTAAARLNLAVLSLAAPRGIQVDVQQYGRALSVRLRYVSGLTIHTETTAKGWREALRRTESTLAAYA